jgi:hypothetical protein
MNYYGRFYWSALQTLLQSSGWSVLVQGVAAELTERSEIDASFAALAEPWGVAGDADRVVEDRGGDN